MSKLVKVIVLRTAGTNCDRETVFAFEHFGASVETVHINALLRSQVRLTDFHILAIPGGFTYGDDIISGRILANELRLRLGADLKKFIAAGKLIIGICNGFQVLVRAGILPGPIDGDEGWSPDIKQSVSLTYNDSGKFIDRWVHLSLSGQSVWTAGVKKLIYVPIAHAEGKFIPQNDQVLKQLLANGQVAFRYCSADGEDTSCPFNPNGSVYDIAGITDKTGRILGLMPHPERHFLSIQHPSWTRIEGRGQYGDGAKIFENGVGYVKEHLL